jgi:hypothetical protein
VTAGAWACWAGILLPLSVDGAASVPLGNYDLRWTYFAFAAACALGTAAAFAGERRARAALGAWIRDPASSLFVGMAAVGFVGLGNAIDANRSALFLAWTAGTLLAVPPVVAFLRSVLGRWLPRTFAAYLALQCVVIAWDATVSALGAPGLVVGRTGDSPFPRPHAWYQEPSYAAAFALLCLPWLRAEGREERGAWPTAFTSCRALAITAALLTASRLGLIGAVGVLLVDGISRVGRRTGSGSRLRALCLALAAAAAAAALASFEGTRWAWRSLADPSQPSSIPERAETARMALRVFSDHPWVGVGPGGAGPYYVATYPDDLRAGIRERRGHVGRTWDLARQPLSHNLATELLSEWGALGTAFFLVGLGFLLRGPRGRDLAEIAWVLAIVAASVQTVPRFDLWICLELVWAGPAPPSDGAAGSMRP